MGSRRRSSGIDSKICNSPKITQRVPPIWKGLSHINLFHTPMLSRKKSPQEKLALPSISNSWILRDGRNPLYSLDSRSLSPMLPLVRTQAGAKAPLSALPPIELDKLTSRASSTSWSKSNVNLLALAQSKLLSSACITFTTFFSPSSLVSPSSSSTLNSLQKWAMLVKYVNFWSDFLYLIIYFGGWNASYRYDLKLYVGLVCMLLKDVSKYN